MFNCCLSPAVSIQVSAAHVNILSIIMVFSLNFSFFGVFLFTPDNLSKFCFGIVLFLFITVQSTKAQVRTEGSPLHCRFIVCGGSDAVA